MTIFDMKKRLLIKHTQLNRIEGDIVNNIESEETLAVVRSTCSK